MSVVFQIADNKEGEGHHDYNAVITIFLGYTNDPVNELSELTKELLDLLRDVNRDGNENDYSQVMNLLKAMALDMNSIKSLELKGDKPCQQ